MPELPEVETLRRQLEPLLLGEKVKALTVLDPRWCQPQSAPKLEQTVAGSKITALKRRGKYLILLLKKGQQEPKLLMHLRMTGNLLYRELGKDRPAQHLRAELELGDGSTVSFVDPRRFGQGALLRDDKELTQYFEQRLGLEPLSKKLNPAEIYKLSRSRRTPIKAFLLDQKQIAGIGNIYADEALFRAGVHPSQLTGTLQEGECKELCAAIVDALKLGIKNGGASIDDFRHYNGGSGGMQDEFLVHRREGEPCPNCSQAVVKLRVAGRGTYICSNCQRLKNRKLVRS